MPTNPSLEARYQAILREYGAEKKGHWGQRTKEKLMSEEGKEPENKIEEEPEEESSSYEERYSEILKRHGIEGSRGG